MNMTGNICKIVVTAVVALMLSPISHSFAANPADTKILAETKRMDELAASESPAVVSSQISEDFSALAGSTENANTLVAALRNGETASITSGGSTGTVAPSRKKGWGEVFISLALAQESLTQSGVSSPTGSQLADALNGILNQRASGMGWGEIANTMGVKLGQVVSGIKAGNEKLAAGIRREHGVSHKVEKAERAQRAERPEKPQRPPRPERPGKS